MTRVATLLRLMVANELLWALGIATWLATSRGWPVAAAAAVGIATPLAAHAAIVGWNFVVASVAGSPTPPEHRLGPWRAALLYLREVIDSIVVFQWAQPWLASRPLAGEAATGTGRVPVLLVHGYFCNRQVWRAMARMLAGRGHPVGAVDLEPVFASIDDYVPAIERGVRELAQRTGAAEVALVCHSMGGLAARAYLRARGSGSIARVITLGSPHRGTAHARLGLGRNASEMCPDSDWLAALRAHESPETGALFTVVLSHHDNIVSPQAHQTIAHARTVAVSGLGHLTLARAPEIGRVVLRALGGD